MKGGAHSGLLKNKPDIVLEKVLQLLGHVYHKHPLETKLHFQPPPAGNDVLLKPASSRFTMPLPYHHN